MRPHAKIIEDGETLRVPLILMDRVQRSIAAQTIAIDERHDAYADYKRQLSDQWRNSDAESGIVPDADPYAAYVRRTADAWKGS